MTRYDLTSNCETRPSRSLWSENSLRLAATIFSLAAVALATICLTGCEALEKGHPSTSNQISTTNAGDGNGYALLFDLVGDEKDLSKLRFLKHEPPALKNLANAIAATNRIAYKELEELGKANPSLNLKQTGLPSDEVHTRDSISKFKEHALLSQKGKEFQLQLLLSQNEGLIYGTHLANTTAAHEANPARKRMLQKIGSDLGKLQEQIFQMILSNYSGITYK